MMKMRVRHVVESLRKASDSLDIRWMWPVGIQRMPGIEDDMMINDHQRIYAVTINWKTLWQRGFYPNREGVTPFIRWLRIGPVLFETWNLSPDPESIFIASAEGKLKPESPESPR